MLCYLSEVNNDFDIRLKKEEHKIYSVISLMNVNSKILNKYWQTEVITLLF